MTITINGRTFSSDADRMKLMDEWIKRVDVAMGRQPDGDESSDDTEEA